MNKKKVLHLILKRRWYNLIERGEKTEEYRDITPYWTKRICGTDFLQDTVTTTEFTHVIFHYGYSNRTMEFRIESVTTGRGNPEWGAPEDKDVFIIRLKK